MTIDLNARAEPFAIYLPSIQTHSAARVVKPDDAMRDGRLPKKLQPRDLNFLDPSNRYWHYKWCLATAGHFKDEKKSNSITNRSPNTLVVGDSGGFQIGHGTLGETAEWKKLSKKPQTIMSLWRSSDVKRDILRWLELNCDLAMTIDMPIWAIGLKHSPFANLTHNELTTLSVENLQFISNQRGKYGSCKFLNVLQGDSEQAEEHWFQAVKAYPFEGWSFAGGVGQMGGIYRVLRRTLLLRDQKLLDPPNDWLHILRLSRVRWSPLMTAIQRAVRDTVNPNFTVSFDSSSPFQVSGKGAKYAVLNSFGNTFKKAWSVSAKKFPTGYGYANIKKRMSLNKAHVGHLDVAVDSPIARLLTVQDLNIKTYHMAVSTFDEFSDEVLINHNVYTYVLANILANEAVFSQSPIAPPDMLEGVEIIDQLFRVENWSSLLNKKRERLRRLVKDSVGK